MPAEPIGLNEEIDTLRQVLLVPGLPPTAPLQKPASVEGLCGGTIAGIWTEEKRALLPVSRPFDGFVES